MNAEKKTVRLSPLNNLVFSCIFQSKEKAGKAMLEFLNAILVHVGEEPIEEIISMVSEYPLISDSVGQKYGRLDVRVKTESGRIFDIEVQIEKDFVNERSFFYGGKLVTNKFESGLTYDKMPPVRVINIVDFYIRDDHENVVEPVVMVYENDREKQATDVFKMYHIQMPVFRKKYQTMESVKDDLFLTWLYMLDKGYENSEEMEELAAMTEGMLSFAKQYNIAINDPLLVRRYQMDQDAKREEAFRMSLAETKGFKRGEEKGFKQGEEKGKKANQLENARRMKADGLDPKLIEKYTGLSETEIINL
ncbi:MAG: Rpn family recombination-promoting nuclease/putative transposase [Anaerolineaceae bacterium]|nr:Rpn family recombination-promoting nuclease/putative transposase [Anaerolineaceae bacterium]